MEVVIGAVVSAVALVLVALIGRGMFDRRIRKTIGHSNGRGSIVEMNERQLDMIAGLQESVKHVEQHRIEAETKTKELANAVGAVNLNLQSIARFQNLISGVRLDFEGRFDEISLLLGELDHRLSDVEQQQQKVTAQRFRIPHIPSRQVDHPPVNE